MKRKIVSKETMVFVVLLIGIILFDLHRIRWGMADVDEGFYLTIPYRLIQGDALLVDEWHVSQLSAVIVLPVLKVYLYFAKSTEGIILAFRYIYLVLHGLIACFSYKLLSKQKRSLALCSSIIFFIYTPFNIMTLSYNTMGLDFVYLLSIMAVDWNNQKAVGHFITGVLYALAVLCNPYLMVICIVILFIILYQFLCDKNKTLVRQWGCFVIGAGLIGIMFIIFVLSKTDIKEIIKNIPLILDNSAHEPKTLKTFFLPIIEFSLKHWWYFSVLGISFITGVLIKIKQANCFLIAIIISMIAELYWAITVTNGIGYAAIMIPLSLLGLIAFIYTERKEYSLLTGYIIGGIYAVCMNIASNTGMYAISNACTVTSCISIWLIKNYMDENANFFKKEIIFISIIFSQLFSQLYVNNQHVFWEVSPELLVSEIENGPAKGILTTEEKNTIYKDNYLNLLEIKKDFNCSGKKLLLFKEFPCGYLIMEDMIMGAYSAWLYDVAENPNDQKMSIYYQMHPEKTPDIVYVDVESAKIWDKEKWEKYAENNNYKHIEFLNGGWLFYNEGGIM